MRHPPVLKYNGLTIVLSNPGRFDLKSGKLISSYADKILIKHLHPFSRYGCDIFTLDNIRQPLLPNTKCILFCGDDCLSVLGQDKTALNHLRGSVFFYKGIPAIPTYHSQDAIDKQNYESTHNPLALKKEDEEGEEDEESSVKNRGRTKRENYPFWWGKDIEKARDIVTNGVKINSCQYVLSPPLDEAIHWLKAQQDRLYLDIETERSTQQIICIGISANAKKVYVVPFSPSVAPFIRELALAFQRCKEVILHNAMYDLHILAWQYKVLPPRNIRDTMIIQHRMFPEVEKSLGHCISLYTHQTYHKSLAHQEGQFLLYNAKDVETTALVYEEQLLRLGDAYESAMHGCSLIRPYLLCKLRGLRFNDETLLPFTSELQRRSLFFESRVLPLLVGHDLNPRSPLQVATYLYDELKLPKPKKDPTNKRQLYKLALTEDVPALSVILACRRWSKQKGILSFKPGPQKDDQVTCEWKLTGTETFRLASAKLLGNYGTNLQNWPKALRKHIIPWHKENVFVQVDQAGAEALIVAYLCPAGKLRELFHAKIKPHVYTALGLFPDVWSKMLDMDVQQFIDAPINQLKTMQGWNDLETMIKASDNNPPSTRYYYHAKQTVHSANYGIHASTFVMGVLDKSEGEVIIPLAEGARFLKVYRDDLFPELHQWHSLVIDEVKKTGKLKNLFGYPRIFNGDVEDNHARMEMIAFSPQSTVGCITTTAHVEIQQKLDAHEYEGFAVLQNNHDSLLFECPESKVDEVILIAQRHINRELVGTDGTKFTMKTESSVGKNWKDMK